MFKLIVGSFLIFTFAFSQDLIWEPTFGNANYKALKENKPIMLMYTKKNCIDCEYMDEITFKNSKVFEYLNRYFILLKRDVDYDKPIKDLISFSPPTFYFLKPSGEIIGRHLVGGFEEKTFYKILKEYKEKSTK